jgi:hypothetical protein
MEHNSQAAAICVTRSETSSGHATVAVRDHCTVHGMFRYGPRAACSDSDYKL